jgi:uncharacterized protein (DUF2249 family)
MSESPADSTRTLDVRDIDGEPFGEIMAALDALPEDDRLVLIAGFEPVPLYDVLADRGFSHDTERGDGGEFRVTIEHT